MFVKWPMFSQEVGRTIPVTTVVFFYTDRTRAMLCKHTFTWEGEREALLSNADHCARIAVDRISANRGQASFRRIDFFLPCKEFQKESRQFEIGLDLRRFEEENLKIFAPNEDG